MMKPYTSERGTETPGTRGTRGAALERKTAEHDVHDEQQHLRRQPPVHERILVQHVASIIAAVSSTVSMV